MTIEEEVDQLIDERPGRELLHAVYDEKAFAINDFIYRSAGTTASYAIHTNVGRVIVNTGMGWEAPHHKHLFDEAISGKTTHIITTQGHVDHVGGVSLFRDEDTQYVAQANNRACQADDTRLTQFRAKTALIWFPYLPERVKEFMNRYPGQSRGQDVPTPDITFEDRLVISPGDLEIELIATPGGETIDSCVVWLPQHRIAILSNLFGPLFPHFPNFNTLRGDKCRFPVPYMENVLRVRALKPELLITGRHDPILGEELIDACLARLYDAVDYVHQATLDGINSGNDVYSIMQEVRLPESLRVGQGYGKVEWGVRTIWEIYTGWFQRNSSAELYASNPAEAAKELAALADAASILERSRSLLEVGEIATAIRLAEAILANDPQNQHARRLMADAHRTLLADGGDTSFWESGWLRDELSQWSQAD